MAPPLFANPFARKQPQGGGGKEAQPSGEGLPPVAEPPAGLTAVETTPEKAPEKQLTPLEIALNEADTAFSPLMDDLEKQQNPEEPFFVRFGWAKGEKNPKSSSASNTGAWTDTRILLLIALNTEGSFFAITRRGPEEIKPKDEYETKKIKQIIDYCLTHGKDHSVGGYIFPDTQGKENLLIGYDPVNSRFDDMRSRDAIQHNFDPSLSPVPSDEAVSASIQASKDLAHARAEEKQTPLREAQEQARKAKESAERLSNLLRKVMS